MPTVSGLLHKIFQQSGIEKRAVVKPRVFQFPTSLLGLAGFGGPLNDKRVLNRQINRNNAPALLPLGVPFARVFICQVRIVRKIETGNLSRLVRKCVKVLACPMIHHQRLAVLVNDLAVAEPRLELRRIGQQFAGLVHDQVASFVWIPNDFIASNNAIKSQRFYEVRGVWICGIKFSGILECCVAKHKIHEQALCAIRSLQNKWIPRPPSLNRNFFDNTVRRVHFGK